jgi:hypothetical protein
MNLFYQLTRILESLPHFERRSKVLSRSTAPRARPTLEGLEDRYLLASTISAAFGAGAGGSPDVAVLFDDGTQMTFPVFPLGFKGGVSAIIGHVNGNSIPDVIVGAGSGGGPEVEVFNGADLVAGQIVITASFMAFDPSFSGGVTLAAGPVLGTGHDDVVVGTGPGGSPQIAVFSGADLAQGIVAPTTFGAFVPGFTGGVKVAVGAINGTGHDDVVAGAGLGGGPAVEIFDGAQLANGVAVPTAQFFAFPVGFTGGVSIALGAVNGTGHDDVVVGAGPGGGPEVVVFDGAQLAHGVATPTAAFFAFPTSFSGGVSVAAGPVNGTGHDDVIVGAGPGGGPEVEVFGGAQLASGSAVATAAFMAFDPAFGGGVQVTTAAAAGSPNANVIAVAGPGGGPQVNVYSGALLASGQVSVIDSFFAFSPNFQGGVNLGFNFADFRKRRPPVTTVVPPIVPGPVGIGGTATVGIGSTVGIGGTVGTPGPTGGFCCGGGTAGFGGTGTSG